MGFGVGTGVGPGVGGLVGRLCPEVGLSVVGRLVGRLCPGAYPHGVGPEVGLSVVGSAVGAVCLPVGLSVGSPLAPPVGCGDSFLPEGAFVDGLCVTDLSRGPSVGCWVGVLSLHHGVGLSVG